MRYFKFASENAADKVSSYFYKLMYPESKNVTTTHLFGWIVLKNGEVIIQIDELMKCPVYQKAITDTTLNQIVTYLSSYLTQTQINQLKTYVKNNSLIDLIKLIPSQLTEVNAKYITDNLNSP